MHTQQEAGKGAWVAGGGCACTQQQATGMGAWAGGGVVCWYGNVDLTRAHGPRGCTFGQPQAS